MPLFTYSPGQSQTTRIYLLFIQKLVQVFIQDKLIVRKLVFMFKKQLEIRHNLYCICAINGHLTAYNQARQDEDAMWQSKRKILEKRKLREIQVSLSPALIIFSNVFFYNTALVTQVQLFALLADFALYVTAPHEAAIALFFRINPSRLVASSAAEPCKRIKL